MSFHSYSEAENFRLGITTGSLLLLSTVYKLYKRCLFLPSFFMPIFTTPTRILILSTSQKYLELHPLCPLCLNQLQSTIQTLHWRSLHHWGTTSISAQLEEVVLTPVRPSNPG
jgi:hypothetical protein